MPSEGGTTFRIPQVDRSRQVAGIPPEDRRARYGNERCRRAGNGSVRSPGLEARPRIKPQRGVQGHGGVRTRCHRTCPGAALPPAPGKRVPLRTLPEGTALRINRAGFGAWSTGAHRGPGPGYADSGLPAYHKKLRRPSSDSCRHRYAESRPGQASVQMSAESAWSCSFFLLRTAKIPIITAIHIELYRMLDMLTYMYGVASIMFTLSVIALVLMSDMPVL